MIPLVDDPAPLLTELQQAEVKLALIKDEDGEKALVAAKRHRDELKARYNDQFAEVWIRAMPRADYEALCQEHSTDDGADWDALLPAILAESCEDESLRDADWWAGEFASDRWPQGDWLAVQSTVLQLNMSTPQPLVGKG